LCPAEAFADSRLGTHLDFQVHSGRRSRQSRATSNKIRSLRSHDDLAARVISESGFGERWQSQHSRPM
jgi:hypothetical protein